MSDDDLWRPQEPAEGPSDEPAGPAEPEQPAEPDLTQPITGPSSTGEPSAQTPPAAPGPSYPSPSGPGAVPPPTNPFGAAGGTPQQSPYGAPPPQNPYGPGPQQPYGAPQYPYPPPPNPYPQPGAFDQYATPQPYGGGYPPAYGGVLPDHPSAGLAMGLGITGLIGIVFCQLLLFAAPFAWAIGGKAVREIDAQPGRYGGRDKAQAGRVMGIIGTVVLGLGLLALVVVIVVAVAASTTSPTPVQPNPSFQNG